MFDLKIENGLISSIFVFIRRSDKLKRGTVKLVSNSLPFVQREMTALDN